METRGLGDILEKFHSSMGSGNEKDANTSLSRTFLPWLRRNLALDGASISFRCWNYLNLRYAPWFFFLQQDIFMNTTMSVLSGWWRQHRDSRNWPLKGERILKFSTHWSVHYPILLVHDGWALLATGEMQPPHLLKNTNSLLSQAIYNSHFNHLIFYLSVLVT